jgi:hypothetical protein
MPLVRRGFDKNSSPNDVIGVYREYAPVAKAIREETVVPQPAAAWRLPPSDLIRYAPPVPATKEVAQMTKTLAHCLRRRAPL